MLRPQGIIPAVVTPFAADQSINEESLRALINRLIHAGVHGLFVLGTNGEFFALSECEKARVVQIAAEEADGRVPVYAGSGGISTGDTISLTRRLADSGADAVSVITPYFLQFNNQELLQHYQAIAASTHLPVLLYNIPGNTGNTITGAMVAELAKCDNIVGIKDSSGRLDVILQYLDAAQGDMAVLAGTDSLILSTLLAGGQGAIASTANLLPEVVVSIYQHWLNGQIHEASTAQNALRPLRQSFQWGTIPSVLKEAMNMLGLSVGSPRQPVAVLGEAEKMKLEQMMQHYHAHKWIADEPSVH